MIINKKNKRIKIKTIKDFKLLLEKEGYNTNGFYERDYKFKLANSLKTRIHIIDNLYMYLNDEETSFNVENISDLISYIELMMEFNNNVIAINELLRDYEYIVIKRKEYEKVVVKEEINHKYDIDIIKKNISRRIDEIGISKIEQSEKLLRDKNLFTKDIELLKKILIYNSNDVEESYDEIKKERKIKIKIEDHINCIYRISKLGTVEHKEFLKNNIKRLHKIIHMIDDYIEKHNNIGIINQSSLLQDTINIACAVFNDKEVISISGNIDAKGFCNIVKDEKQAFKSFRVNRHGISGTGYDRKNDSEKKILEEINRIIQEEDENRKGKLIIYSKLEPCESCYYAMCQFMDKYPDIDISVHYHMKYGQI